jgi:hypothetical protein
MLKNKKRSAEEMRSFLITFAVVLSYVVFVMIGMIVVKYNPWVMVITDYAILPIGLATILFLYLFAMTYEKKQAEKIPEKTRECVRLYGEGKSFNEIKEQMGLSSPSDVKRMLTEFCQRGVEG